MTTKLALRPIRYSLNKVLFLVILSYGFGTMAIGQEQDQEEQTKKYRFLKLIPQYGLLLPGEIYLDDLTPEPVQASQVVGLAIEFGWQGRGSSIYDAKLNYPTYGIGLNSYAFPGTSQLGYPNALYAFLNAPARRWTNWSVNYILRLGLGYNWRPHDPVDNPAQFVLGSYRNLYINGGFEAEYYLGERWDFAFGLTASHFSNGRSSEPNASVNLVNPHLSVKYNLNRGQRPNYDYGEVPDYDQQHWEWFLMFGAGNRQIIFDPPVTGLPTPVGLNYPMWNFSTAAQKQLNWLVKVGGGIDFMYSGVTDAKVEQGPGGIIRPVPVPFADKIQIGVFGIFEWVLNNVSVAVQPGWKVIRKPGGDDSENFYQHLQLRYHIDDVILGVAIRATRFSNAEYIEWSLGYRLKWDKNGLIK